ncbi:MAG: transposase zinc-binding domain-containing protein, partial [Gammaproteobacteria bacterium]
SRLRDPQLSLGQALAHGFARARCGGCGHDFLIAYSCKGRVCPACNTRRMAETAAHLVDEVFPQVPVRQWVLSLPKRLRYFLHHDPALIGPVLRDISAGG